MQEAAHKGAAELASEGEATDGCIIRNVNAVVRRGELMAIIGGSSSGIRLLCSNSGSEVKNDVHMREKATSMG